jgi:hypothetical protein
MNTEYIITAQVKNDLDGDDSADWKVCRTYESARSWTKWFEDRYKFVYVRECSSPLTIGRS